MMSVPFPAGFCALMKVWTCLDLGVHRRALRDALDPEVVRRRHRALLAHALPAAPLLPALVLPEMFRHTASSWRRRQRGYQRDRPGAARRVYRGAAHVVVGDHPRCCAGTGAV